METVKLGKAVQTIAAIPPESTTQQCLSRTTSEIARENRQRLSAAQQEQAVAERLTRLKTQIGPRYANCSLDNFELSADASIRRKQESVLTKVRSYSDDIRARTRDGVGLGLIGPVGVGKDFLQSALMLEAIRCGPRVEWRDGMALAREFRSVIDGDESEAQTISRLTGCDILAISDPVPPSGSLSAFLKEKLFAVVDERYRNRRPTWWTLNAKDRAEAEERLSIQVVDRLADGALCIVCDWPSYRLSRRWTEGGQND